MKALDRLSYVVAALGMIAFVLSFTLGHRDFGPPTTYLLLAATLSVASALPANLPNKIVLIFGGIVALGIQYLPPEPKSEVLAGPLIVAILFRTGWWILAGLKKE